jgi:hypothetical protein
LARHRHELSLPSRAERWLRRPKSRPSGASTGAAGIGEALGRCVVQDTFCAGLIFYLCIPCWAEVVRAFRLFARIVFSRYVSGCPEMSFASFWRTNGQFTHHYYRHTCPQRCRCLLRARWFLIGRCSSCLCVIGYARLFAWMDCVFGYTWFFVFRSAAECRVARHPWRQSGRPSLTEMRGLAALFLYLAVITSVTV